jgi:hypothetical protein
MKKSAPIDTKVIYKSRLKPQAKLIIGILGIAIFSLLTTVFLFKYFQKPEYNKIYYSEQSDLDYKVYLKPNSYFEAPYLGKDNQYIASIIDYIAFNFNYSFKSTKNRNYTYKYSIDATVNANEKGFPDKVLYTKKTRILDEVTGSVTNNNTFYINQTTNIDYSKYNDVINNFKKDYVLSIDSNLTLTFNIDIETIDSEGNKVNIKPKAMTVVIPLSEQTIKISINYNKISESNIASGIINNPNATKYLLISGINIVLDIISIIIIIKTITRLNHNKTEYMKTLNKIMGEYDKVIVKAKNIPILNDYKVIQIESFDEMLDARDTLESNILYFEVDKNHKSLFLIIHEDLAYVYILSDEDLNHAKK